MGQARSAKYIYEFCTSTKMSIVMLYRCVDACSMLCSLRDDLRVVGRSMTYENRCRVRFRLFYLLYWLLPLLLTVTSTAIYNPLTTASSHPALTHQALRRRQVQPADSQASPPP